MAKLTTRILTATVLCSTISMAAFAGSPLLEKADTNKDGLIQLSEFTSHANQRFTDMDADANGLVTKEERQAFREQMRETRAQEKFAKTDSNGDGFISKSEYDAARAERAERFKSRLDTNGDGQIDQADRQERKQKRWKKNKERRQLMKTRGNIDSNGDGAVDLAEHQAATTARFERMDSNADGVLSAEEQRPLRGKHGKRHGMRR